MKAGELKSMQIYLGEKEKYPTRLVLEKVPPKLGDEKCRKLNPYPQSPYSSLKKKHSW